jgi:hypothetical protein
MRSWTPSPAQFRIVDILYSELLKRLGKLRLVEMRIAPRTGKTSDVYQRTDLMCKKNLSELIGRAS